MCSPSDPSNGSAPPSPDDLATPAEVLDHLLAVPPGPEPIRRLAELSRVPLDQTERVLLLRAWDRQASWVAAEQLAAIRGVAGATPPVDRDLDADVVGPEVAGALRLAQGSALNRICFARALAGQLRPTGEALRAGRIGFLHALRIYEALDGKPPEITAGVQQAVLGAAANQSPSELSRSIRQAVAEAAPADSERAHADAVRTRQVALYPEPDGMATVAARLVATDASLVYRALTRWAERARRADRAAGQSRDEEPGLDARRADALVAIARRSLEPAYADRRPPPVELGVVIDLATLFGLADRPGHLAGYGPLPASLVRDLAGDAGWRRLVTDPRTGELLDLGRGTYTPSSAMRDFIGKRDRRCRFPHCHRPAWACDRDHVVPFHRGGETTRANLQAACHPSPGQDRGGLGRRPRAGRDVGLGQPGRDAVPRAAEPVSARGLARPPRRIQGDPSRPPREPSRVRHCRLD